MNVSFFKKGKRPFLTIKHLTNNSITIIAALKAIVQL